MQREYKRHPTEIVPACKLRVGDMVVTRQGDVLSVSGSLLARLPIDGNVRRIAA